MTPIKDKINAGIQECHILVLGAQVLLGFEFQAVFLEGFDKLTPFFQQLLLASLVLMLIAVGLLLGAVAYHRLAQGGEDSEDLHCVLSRLSAWSLLPFAGGIGASLTLATGKVFPLAPALFAGVLGTGLTLFFWYGLEAITVMKRSATRSAPPPLPQPDEQEPSDVRSKISVMLEEIRVVLPGSQALMGFQLTTMLTNGFDLLPLSSKYIHLGSLTLIALSVVLLMTPAAYHRIVEVGEHTESFHRFASRIILAAMVPLAMGLSGDLFIVTRKVTGSITFGVVLSSVIFLFFCGLWFGFSAYRRHAQRPKTPDPTPRLAGTAGK